MNVLRITSLLLGSEVVVIPGDILTFHSLWFAHGEVEASQDHKTRKSVIFSQVLSVSTNYYKITTVSVSISFYKDSDQTAP